MQTGVNKNSFYHFFCLHFFFDIFLLNFISYFFHTCILNQNLSMVRATVKDVTRLVSGSFSNRLNYHFVEERKLNQKEVKQIPIGPVIILCTICNLQPRRDKSKFCTDECAYKSTLRSNAKSIKNARAIKKVSKE
jgi:hypothetical protein